MSKMKNKMIEKINEGVDMEEPKVTIMDCGVSIQESQYEEEQLFHITCLPPHVQKLLVAYWEWRQEEAKRVEDSQNEVVKYPTDLKEMLLISYNMRKLETVPVIQPPLMELTINEKTQDIMRWLSWYIMRREPTDVEWVRELLSELSNTFESEEGITKFWENLTDELPTLKCGH